MALATSILIAGTRGAQPAASSANNGVYYRVTDEGNIVEQSTGAAWVGIAGASNPNAVTAAGTLTSGQPVLGGGSKAAAVGPINLAGGASFVTGVLPVANGGTGSASGAGLLVATVTLTDAQVKALPTTAVTVVSAPASGSRVRPIAVSYLANFAAGAYTNINTTYCDIHLALGTDYVGYGPVNDSTTTPTLTLVTDIFGSAANRMFDQGLPPQQATPSAGASGYVQTIAFFNKNQQDNTALQIKADNNGSGAFTGGNAANTLKVIVYYAVETW